jgi:hypothetical protein
MFSLTRDAGTRFPVFLVVTLNGLAFVLVEWIGFCFEEVILLL